MVALQIATWAATISAFIRSLDANHMISTGEVGYDILPEQTSGQCGPCAERNPQANSLAARLDVPNPFDVFHNFINCAADCLSHLTLSAAMHMSDSCA